MGSPSIEQIETEKLLEARLDVRRMVHALEATHGKAIARRALEIVLGHPTMGDPYKRGNQ